MPLECWQIWGVNWLSRKAASMFDHPFGKEMLPHAKSLELATHILSLDAKKNSSAPLSPLPPLRKLQTVRGHPSVSTKLGKPKIICSLEEMFSSPSILKWAVTCYHLGSTHEVYTSAMNRERHEAGFLSCGSTQHLNCRVQDEAILWYHKMWNCIWKVKFLKTYILLQT